MNTVACYCESTSDVTSSIRVPVYRGCVTVYPLRAFSKACIPWNVTASPSQMLPVQYSMDTVACYCESTAGITISIERLYTVACYWVSTAGVTRSVEHLSTVACYCESTAGVTSSVEIRYTVACYCGSREGVTNSKKKKFVFDEKCSGLYIYWLEL
jgi:hypothetical protein